MSIDPSSPWRGCAAFLPQPVSQEDERAAQVLVETVYYYNCRVLRPPLPDIIYRSSSGEKDILNHVFRWDLTPYQQAFENGFRARRQDHTPDDVYFSLEHYVHNGGRPIDSQRFTTHAFVSTTLNPNWHPTINPGSGSVEIYRYEIYAPGGIFVAETLGQYYQYPAQDEVCFVEGIAPQYIRSAQRFRLSSPAGSSFTRMERVDTVLVINARVNPQSHPYRALPILRPVDYYMENRKRVDLTILYNNDPDTDWYAIGEARTPEADWYAIGAAKTDGYINAAFRSSRTNEAYLFMKNEYVLVDYAPGTTNDRVLNGPIFICDGFQSLMGTAFAEHGIDCSFGSHDTNEAFIFCGNLCAQINYAPHSTDDRIIRGPMTIATMFPFFKGTVFESGIDAAFESTTRYEVYLFKGNQHARINYNGSTSHLINTVRPITQTFPSLGGTIFENGIDAAFASHITNEAYLFKGDSYARINFAPGTMNDHIIGGVRKIVPGSWPSLRDILPRKNHGLDVHDHANPPAQRDHDEL